MNHAHKEAKCRASEQLILFLVAVAVPSTTIACNGCAPRPPTQGSIHAPAAATSSGARDHRGTRSDHATLPGPHLQIDDAAHRSTLVAVEEGQGAEPTAARAVVLRLQQDSVQLSPVRELPVVPTANHRGQKPLVATHYADRLAVAEAAGNGYQVRVDAPEGGTPQIIAVGAVAPAALHLVENDLFVGAGERVLWARTNETNTASELISRAGQTGKAYDIFARHDRRLIAIDDMVVPLYGDLIALRENGPERLADWTLPVLVNGQYSDAFLRPKGDAHELVMLSHFGVISGYGQILSNLELEGTRLSHDGETNIVNPSQGDPVLEEFERRGGVGGSATLVAGQTLTRWLGVAPVPESRLIAIAAGDRGLILVTPPLPGTDVATAMDLGGSCLDVRAAGNRLVALVQGPTETETFELIYDEASDNETNVTVLRRTRLPIGATRFLR